MTLGEFVPFVLLALLLVQWILLDRIFATVKRDYPVIWERLGSRERWVMGWWGEGLDFHRFIWNSESFNVGRGLRFMTRMSRAAEVLFVVLMLVAAAMTLLDLN